jgi:metallophosphoesterase superfamily enzyme
MNNDWNWLELWRDLFPQIRMTLIQGNHDILQAGYYEKANFEVFRTLHKDPFLFIHDNKDSEHLSDTKTYVLSGHIHPAVKLKGKGRQSLLLSCFYFGENAGILPAFGKFTGKCCVKIMENDMIFGILDKKVLKVNAF